jgi:hypothetical protein
MLGSTKIPLADISAAMHARTHAERVYRHGVIETEQYSPAIWGLGRSSKLFSRMSANIRGRVSSVRAKMNKKGLHTALKISECMLSFVVQCRMITSCEATQDVFSAFSIATHPMNPTRFGRKRTNAGNSTKEDRRTVTLFTRLHFVQRLLAGRKSALVDNILGVLLFDIARAVERRAGESHETCRIEWLASFIRM